MNILSYDDQINLLAYWLKTNKVENVEGSVNKEIVRYQLRTEFSIENDEVVDEVYNAIIQ